MDTTLLFGIAVIPAIVGLVQVVKDLGLPSNYAPLAAVVFGLAWPASPSSTRGSSPGSPRPSPG